LLSTVYPSLSLCPFLPRIHLHLSLTPPFLDAPNAESVHVEQKDPMQEEESLPDDDSNGHCIFIFMGGGKRKLTNQVQTPN